MTRAAPHIATHTPIIRVGLIYPHPFGGSRQTGAGARLGLDRRVVFVELVVHLGRGSVKGLFG